MKPSFAVLGAWLLMAGALIAAPLFDEAVPALTLKDGTVLRDAQIKAYAPKVVMVKHRDGARTVPYNLFPDEYQRALGARRPVPRAERASVKPLPGANKTAATVNADPELRYGCSFMAGRLTGDAIPIEIHNESNDPVRLIPEMFVAKTYSGEKLPGTQWVGLNSEGRVAVVLKRQQEVAPGEVVTLQLIVSARPHEGGIETVQWQD